MKTVLEPSAGICFLFDRSSTSRMDLRLLSSLMKNKPERDFGGSFLEAASIGGKQMVNKNKVISLPKGVKQSLLINIEQELFYFGEDDGYASPRLTKLLLNMEIIDDLTCKKQTLLQIKSLLA